jgi:hypothetical protein
MLDIELLCNQLDTILANVIVQRLRKIYEDKNISLIVLIPAPRNSKSVLLPAFIDMFSKNLHSQGINYDILNQGFLVGKLVSNKIRNTKSNETILVIQPVYIKDNYFEECISFIEEESVSQNIEVLTIFDPSKRLMERRSNVPNERILIKLKLSLRD